MAGLPTRGGSAVPDAAPAARDAPLVARLREAGAVDPRQDRDARAGLRRHHAGGRQPVGPGPQPGRLQRRLGGGGRDGRGVRRPRHRHGRLDPPARGLLRRQRAEGALRRAADGRHPPARAVDGQRGRLRPQRRRPRGRLARPERRGPGGRPRRSCASACRSPPADADDEIAAAVARGRRAAGGRRRRRPSPCRRGRPGSGRAGGPSVAEALDAHRAAGWYPARASATGPSRSPTSRAPSGSPTPSARRPGRSSPTSRGCCARRSRASTCSRSRPARSRPRRATPTRGRAARELTPLCGPVNAAGLAAASVPCGVTTGGLPIGLQLVGESEAVVLAVASRYQSRSSAHDRRPLPEPSGEARRLRVPPRRHRRGRARAARRAGGGRQGARRRPEPRADDELPARAAAGARRHHAASRTSLHRAATATALRDRRAHPPPARSSTPTTSCWTASASSRRAAPLVGHMPIRARGTFGGSVAHADPSAEWCMLALAARRRDRRPRRRGRARRSRPRSSSSASSRPRSSPARSSPRCASRGRCRHAAIAGVRAPPRRLRDRRRRRGRRVRGRRRAGAPASWSAGSTRSRCASRRPRRCWSAATSATEAIEEAAQAAAARGRARRRHPRQRRATGAS